MSASNSVVTLEYALSDWILNEYPFSVINGEIIAKQIFKLYQGKIYNNKRISRIRADEPGSGVYRIHISQLMSSGIISQIQGFKSNSSSQYPFDGSYLIKSKLEYSAIQAACVIFPHIHISYLSAMDWHGLTVKNPSVVYISTPPKSIWKKLNFESNIDIDIDEKSKFDIGNFFPKFPNENEIFGMKTSVIVDKDRSGVVQVADGPVRVTSAARTFIDMTRKPILCGGADHALSCFIEHAKPHRKNIIKYLDTHGTKIDKARVGFLMDKVMDIRDPTLNLWREESSLTRGSSKILVPGVPFSEFYDPNWSISINSELFQKYGVI